MVEALKRKNTEGSTAVWNMRKCINFEDSDHMSSLSVSGSAVCSLYAVRPCVWASICELVGVAWRLRSRHMELTITRYEEGRSQRK